MSNEPKAMACVIPSRLGVGEEFTLKVKVLGAVRPVPWSCFAWSMTARYAGPFNRNAREFHFCDDLLEEWPGTLRVDGGGPLDGPGEIRFGDGNRGAYPGDTRPLRVVGGFRWKTAGIHFVRLSDPQSGVEAWSNPVHVTAAAPAERIYWGDPHWQTYFSDGLRCPEELYAFARDEAFLDFGALADHVEAATDRQWDYMVAVTNDFNATGRFVTLVGQEWTDWTHRKFGHRNIYYRGDGGAVLRSIDPRYDTLEKLWGALDGVEALVIPHHTANVMMGVDWSHGWHPRLERAVEIYSEWGSSECSAAQGNVLSITHCEGEKTGQHVVDALKRGYRFGFVGGGDVHDGRPGAPEPHYHHPVEEECHPKGLTAVRVSSLTRENVYDAIQERQTYATSGQRIYLDVKPVAERRGRKLTVQAASEDGLREVAVIRNGEVAHRLVPGDDCRVLDAAAPAIELGANDFAYVRVRTGADDFAWSSPVWGPG